MKGIAKVLEDSVAIVTLRMEGIPGYRKIQVARTHVPDDQTGTKELETEDVTPGSVRLTPPEWSRKFSAIQTKAEKLIRAAPRPEGGGSLPAGCYAIPSNRLQEIQEGVQQLATFELGPLVQEFADKFDELMTEKRKRVGEAAWNEIKKVPKPSQIVDGVKLTFRRLPITFVTDAGKQFADEVAGSLIAGLAEAIEQETEKIKVKMAKEGKFVPGTFTALKQQLQLLKDFSFLADEETTSQLLAIEQQLSQDALHRLLNGDISQGGKTIANNLSDSLESLGKTVRKSMGGSSRKIHIPES